MSRDWLALAFPFQHKIGQFDRFGQSLTETVERKQRFCRSVSFRPCNLNCIFNEALKPSDTGGVKYDDKRDNFTVIP